MTWRHSPLRLRPSGFKAARDSVLPVEADIPVSSYNEWDPLEEVIVGRLEGATIPSGHISVISNLPPLAAKLFRLSGGFRYPNWMVRLAQRELDQFIHILESEGIKVRRPDIVDFVRPYRSPHWSSRGFSTACPRDILLIIGNEIIETPSCWRSRYFEAGALFPPQGILLERCTMDCRAKTGTYRSAI